MDTERATTTTPRPLSELCQAIAAELGQGWSAETTEERHDCYLNGPDDMRLHVYDSDFFSSKAGRRIEVSAVRPTLVPEELASLVRGMVTGAIGLGATRPASDLARDITRRLLPGLPDQIAALRSALAEHEADRALRHNGRDQLAARLPGARIGTEDPTGYRSAVSHRGTWELNYDGSRVKLTLDYLPLNTALRIAELVARLD